MNNGFIAVMDSGVGGLSVLKALVNELPGERFIYFGDNKNAPYGSRTNHNLLSLSIKNIIYLKSFGLKGLVVACNTLSVTILDKLRYFAEVPCFGVFPPVETAVLNKERTLLLSTPKTAEKFLDCNVTVLGLPKLVKDIENNLFDLKKVDIKNHIGEEYRGFDTVILGCTHYEFVKIVIFDHLRPKKIVSGEVYTAKKVKKEFLNSKSLEKIKGNQIFFVGENYKINEKFWNKVVKTN